MPIPIHWLLNVAFAAQMAGFYLKSDGNPSRHNSSPIDVGFWSLWAAQAWVLIPTTVYSLRFFPDWAIIYTWPIGRWPAPWLLLSTFAVALIQVALVGLVFAGIRSRPASQTARWRHFALAASILIAAGIASQSFASIGRIAPAEAFWQGDGQPLWQSPILWLHLAAYCIAGLIPIFGRIILRAYAPTQPQQPPRRWEPNHDPNMG